MIGIGAQGRFACVIVTVLSAMVFAGCKAPGDTSGFKPAPVADKTEIQREIDGLKSNPKVPPGVRAMALKDLQDKLAKAK